MNWFSSASLLVVAVDVDVAGGSITVKYCVAECEVTPATVSFAVIRNVATGLSVP